MSRKSAGAEKNEKKRRNPDWYSNKTKIKKNQKGKNSRPSNSSVLNLQKIIKP